MTISIIFNKATTKNMWAFLQTKVSDYDNALMCYRVSGYIL